jgi:hypothetical protein
LWEGLLGKDLLLLLLCCWQGMLGKALLLGLSCAFACAFFEREGGKFAAAVC